MHKNGWRVARTQHGGVFPQIPLVPAAGPHDGNAESPHLSVGTKCGEPLSYPSHRAAPKDGIGERGGARGLDPCLSPLFPGSPSSVRQDRRQVNSFIGDMTRQCWRRNGLASPVRPVSQSSFQPINPFTLNMDPSLLPSSSELQETWTLFVFVFPNLSRLLSDTGLGIPSYSHLTSIFQPIALLVGISFIRWPRSVTLPIERGSSYSLYAQRCLRL